MASSDFFDEATERSRVKTQIITKYFFAWAKVILPSVKKNSDRRLAYIDLFAGPGRYEDQTKSTPLVILENAIANPDLRDALVTHFNDASPEHAQSLAAEIKKLPGIESLQHQPRVHNTLVDEDTARQFEGVRFIPAFFFFDPFGYKGLSLRLINSVLKDWACECLFFFNYNRINMGLPNKAVTDHMNALFGEVKANALRAMLPQLNAYERELLILEELTSALKNLGGKYVLPFCFKSPAKSRTSHHLIFVSKHPRGYGIMKEIMAKESSTFDQGVASFGYCTADQRFPLLFEMTRPLDALAADLLQRFAGSTLTMRQVFDTHNVGTPYISRNYKRALSNLEAKGSIVAVPPAEERPRRKGEVTFGDNVLVTFPPSTAG